MKFKYYVKARKTSFLINIKIFFVLVVFAFLLNSCKKNTYYPLDEDFVQYFGIYKNGSWWSYEDVTTNSTDSIYIKQYRNTWQMYGAKENDLYQYISYNLIGKEKTSIITIMQQDNNSSLLRIRQYKHTIPNFGSFIILKKNNHLSGEDYFPPTGVQKLDSLNIGTHSFSETIKLWNESGDTLWFVKNAGLVKIADENATYNIVDYQLY